MDQTLREGIETEQQQELLRRSGYSRGQGFLYARPMPAPAALEAVRARTVGASAHSLTSAPQPAEAVA